MLKQGFPLQVLRFGTVGLLVMGVFMALNWIFGKWVGEDPAFLLSYPPALGLHFLLNKYWTFGSGGSVPPREAGAYALTVGVTFLIQAGVFKLVTGFTPAPGWLAAGIANAVQTIVSFTLLRQVVFAPSRRG